MQLVARTARPHLLTFTLRTCSCLSTWLCSHKRQHASCKIDTAFRLTPAFGMLSGTLPLALDGTCPTSVLAWLSKLSETCSDMRTSLLCAALATSCCCTTDGAMAIEGSAIITKAWAMVVNGRRDIRGRPGNGLREDEEGSSQGFTSPTRRSQRTGDGCPRSYGK